MNRLAPPIGLLLWLGAALAHAQVASALWGQDGEHWIPSGRLPDFSFAGYRFGEAPLPDVEITADVTAFGAEGDGETDCTEAFRRAIEATERGAIVIPAGTYLIRDILWIRKPGLVLRGAGPGKTIIRCMGDLEDVRPNMGATTSGRPTSNYSWSGGFLWVRGDLPSRTLAAIASECRRGDREITLKEPVALQPGQRVAVELTDDEAKSLLDHLYSGDPGDTSEITRPIRPLMVNRIAAVDGARITLERPLRFDVRTAWAPVLKTFEPTVSEVGIEELSVEFPVKPYQGHFTERGMNAIAMNGVADCWVRNVHISNSDSGIFLSGVSCTIDGLIIESTRPPYQETQGHHGISLGTDCLVENFDFRTHFIHDITLGYLGAGNVIKNGKGLNLSLDHHKKAPHENLFCNLDVGDGGDIWRCGGGSGLGKHCGARGTFWSIRARRDLHWPRAAFGPDSMNLVGLTTRDPSQTDPTGKWFEAIPPEDLRPADLHAAQLERRLRLSQHQPAAEPTSRSAAKP